MISSNHDWHNLNSLRSYPFEYAKIPVSSTGFVFSDELIVDCMVLIQSNEANLFLSSVHFSGNIFTATFYDSILDRDIFMAQCSLSGSYEKSQIISLSDLGISGSVVFGDISKFYQKRLTGLHTFDKNSLKLISYCFSCIGYPSIKSIQYNEQKLQGAVKVSTIGLINTFVNGPEEVTREFNFVGFTQKLRLDQSNALVYLTDPEKIKDICSSIGSSCECPETPIKKINNVSPDPINNNIQIEVGELTFNQSENKFILIAGENSYGLEIDNTDDSIILSLEKNSEEICEETKVIPFPDGRLPSEQFISE